MNWFTPREDGIPGDQRTANPMGCDRVRGGGGRIRASRGLLASRGET